MSTQATFAARVMAWWRSMARAERGYMATGTAVVLAAVAVLGVAGAGASRAVTSLRDGGAWLRNTATGNATHVNGYAGRPDASVRVATPGQQFQIIQRPDGAYVLNPTSHTYMRIDGSTLTASAMPEPGAADSVTVVTGSGTATTWLVDPGAGVAQQVDPATLAPKGAPTKLGQQLTTSVIDNGGVLYLAVPSDGQVVKVSPNGGGRQAVRVGGPGDDISVVVDEAGSRVVAIDATSGQSIPLAGGGKAAPVPSLNQVPPGQSPSEPSSSGPHGPEVSPPDYAPSDYAPPSVGGIDDSGTVVVVHDHHATVAPAEPAATPPPAPTLPATAKIVRVQVLGHVAYLLDVAGHQVVPMDLQTGQLQPPLAFTSGDTPEMVLHGGLLFLNDPAGPSALVIDSAGVVQPITKYTEKKAPKPTAPSTGTAKSPTKNTPGPVRGNPVQGPGAPAPTPTPAPTRQPTGPAHKPGAKPTAPGAPRIIRASPGDASATVLWSPAQPNGSPVIRYTIATSDRQQLTVAGNVFSATIKKLTNDKPITVRVQAANKVGAGPFSAPASVMPSKDVPTAPTNVIASLPKKSTTATVRWGAATASRSPVVKYAVTLSSGAGDRTEYTPDPAVRTHQFTGLAYGRSYTVSVAAVTAKNAGPAATPSAGNLGSASTPLVATNTPTAPRNLRATPLSAGNGLTVTWNAPASNRGAALSAYSLKVGSRSYSPRASSTSQKVTGLTAGTRYTVRLTAHNSAGSSTAVTTTGTPTKPPLQAPNRRQLYQCESSTTNEVYSVTPNPPCQAPQNWRAASRAFTGTSSHLSGTTGVQHCYTVSTFQLQALFVGSCPAGWTNDGRNYFYSWSSKAQANNAGYTAHVVYEYRYPGAGYWYGTAGQSPPSSAWNKTGKSFWT